MNITRPTAALFWEISRRRRGPVYIVIGMMLAGLALKWALNTRVVLEDSWKHLFVNSSGMLMAGSVIFVLAIFNFTESSPEKDWTGFPYRLFVLPLPTLFLVALPLISGITVMSLVCGYWLRIVLTPTDAPEAGWMTLLLVAFMTLFQTVLWCLAGFRLGRMLVLGLAGPVFVIVGFLPWQQVWATDWFSERTLSLLLVSLVLVLFVCSWYCVARQRCGGGRQGNWFRAAIEWILDFLPRRKRPFTSPAGAQFWFEWRRSGIVLPLCVAGMLLFFIRPLSLRCQNDGPLSLQLLCWTIATPVILAAIIGKGFSKPDLWATELSLPTFNMVRPISSGEIVVVRMKVAALSTAISWALVIAFLCFWLPGWADLNSLNAIRIGFWMASGHSAIGEKLIAGLTVVAGILATWKYLVNGLWSGLSGNWNVFLALPFAYALFTILGFVALAIMLNHDDAVRAWFVADPDKPLAWFEALAAMALIAKFVLAARVWRDVSPRRVRRYLVFWLCSTGCLLALAILVWAHGLFDLVLIDIFNFLPWDAQRLLGLMILLALLFMPLARIGLAPRALAKNRHYQ